MSSTGKPVIFLAFANDKVDNAAYLRNLPKELKGIRDALAKAVTAGLVEVVERTSATIDDIISTFQNDYYRGRIAIFHYGGHAGGFELLLENLDGSKSIAHSEGLVSFFARQDSLKLVFLNGCSSQPQALEMVEKGIPAVIGTSQAINDEIATALSVRFYSGLANGSSIDLAWHEAVDEIKTMQGFGRSGDTRALYSMTIKRKEEAGQLPWAIHYKAGAELVKEWNLPEAVENPLFGLPEIPQSYNLPETPFLYLNRYERKHAEIFFGRSYYIREMYRKVTEKNSPPIILLYGKSGVGKSSLLDAGLLPRLESEYFIRYARRDHASGLKGTLVHVLDEALKGFKESAQIKSTENKPASNSAAETEKDQALLKSLQELEKLADPDMKPELGAAIRKVTSRMNFRNSMASRKDGDHSLFEGSIAEKWKAIEEIVNQPLVIILDQVEEMYTRTGKSGSDAELEALLDDLRVPFGSPVNYPNGKLILGYRKEFDAEIERKFKEYELPRTKIFLEHLNYKDITEIFHSLEGEVMKKRYNLSVEPGLAEKIASDLLEDKSSSIAPILQILLTKMWEKAKDQHSHAPKFTLELYEGLKSKGILLDDYFRQQMELLSAWNSELVDTGLGLDLLNFHTTSLGTSQARSSEEILSRYAHCKEEITQVREKLIELHLLDGSSDSTTALIHDTLAPLVQQAFRRSDLNGQRAFRILSNQADEFKANQKNLLGEEDLQIVSAGGMGMPAWTPVEKQLVKLSEEKWQRRKRFMKLVRLAGVVSILAIIGFAGYAYNQKEKAVQNAEIAVLARDSARSATDTAIFAFTVAIGEARRADSMRAISRLRECEADCLSTIAQFEQVKAVLLKNAAEKNERIAKGEFSRAESLRVISDTLKKQDSLRAEKFKALADTNATMREEAFERLVTHNAAFYALKLLEDNQTDVSLFLALQAYMHHGLHHFGEPENEVYTALLQYGASITARKDAHTIRETYGIRRARYLPDKRGILLAGDEGIIHRWVPGHKDFESDRIDLGSKIRLMEVNRRGDLLLASDNSGNVSLYAIPYALEAKQLITKFAEPGLTDLAFLGDEENSFVTIAKNHIMVRTVVGNKIVTTLDTLLASNVNIRHIRTDRSGEFLWVEGNRESTEASPESDFINLWLRQNGGNRNLVMRQDIPGITRFTALAVHPDGKIFATGHESGKIRIFRYYPGTNEIKHIKELNDHTSGITALSFDPTGTQLASSGKDNSARLYTFTIDHKNNWNLLGESLKMPNHSGWVWDVAFSPDGRELLTACEDRTARIYPTTAEVLFKSLCPLNPEFPENHRKTIIQKYMDVEAGYLKPDCR